MLNEMRDFAAAHGDAKGMVGNSAADGVGEFHAGVAVGLGHEDGEFVAAIPADEIGFAGQLSQPAAGRLQHAIAGLMAVGVVDPFELIQIGEDQHEGLLLLPPVVQQQMQFLVECPAIGHSGQFVPPRLLSGMVDFLRLFFEPVARAYQIFLQMPVGSKQGRHVVQQGLFDGFHLAAWRRSLSTCWAFSSISVL